MCGEADLMGDILEMKIQLVKDYVKTVGKKIILS